MALHRAAYQPRQRLAYLFWPNATEAQARNNLRQTLYQMRRVWPAVDQFLAMDAHALGWQAEALVDVDVSAFESAVARADAAERNVDLEAAQFALTQAVDLYRGELLPGSYDEWIEPERDRLRQAHRAALVRLLRLHEARRDYLGAIQRAEQVCRLDPLDEGATVSLMRLHALNGDRASALRVYRECEAVLHQELTVAPGVAVREAYERLLRLEAAPAKPDAPWSTTWPLIGRVDEWGQLQTAWRRAASGQAGFALVTGEAGIGKSRLAEELLAWAWRRPTR